MWEAFRHEFEKIAYAREFAAGVDPFGIWTGRYGQEAERAGTSERKHRTLQALGTAGGVVGGGLLVPSVISGVMGAVGGATKGGWKGLAPAAWKGFKKPVGDLVRAAQATKFLRRAAGSTKGVVPSQKERKMIQSLVAEVPLGEVAGKGVNPEVIKRLQEIGGKTRATSIKGKAQAVQQQLTNVSQARVVPESAEALLGTLQGPIRRGVTGVALGGVVGGVGAYAQYGKGRQAEKGFQKRLEGNA